VSDCHFPGYELLVGELGDGFSVSVRYTEEDILSGVPEEQNGRKWYVPPGQTKGQIVQTCFKAVLTSLEHRAREHFTYRGKLVLQPHMDIDDVWDMLPLHAVPDEPVPFGK
jgi:hypothetical protein